MTFGANPNLSKLFSELYLNANLKLILVFHNAEITQSEIFVILSPNLGILISFEVPKL